MRLAALQGARRSRSRFADREPREPRRERKGQAHPRLEGSRAREWPPDEAGAPEDAGAVRPEWRQLTPEGL